jgi:crotonobetainyl-CoA:carnitine CoA-transferase CaiB-like acyl-CoA transferase
MATNGERVGNRKQIIAMLEDAFADISPEDLLARLAAAA